MGITLARAFPLALAVALTITLPAAGAHNIAITIAFVLTVGGENRYNEGRAWVCRARLWCEM